MFKETFLKKDPLCCCEFVTDSNAIYFIAVCYVMEEICKVEVGRVHYACMSRSTRHGLTYALTAGPVPTGL